MNVWPVITRELREQARQRFTYWLRALGLAALVGAGYLVVLANPMGLSDGVQLFKALHQVLFYAIWILVPLGAADCISYERREGTLGLLFLTPLRPADIVIAKGMAHGLRALTLLVAVLPVMTIPFLLGGITWELAARSALIHFNSICLALAAALIASAFCKRSTRAVTAALALAVIGMGAFAWSIGDSATTRMRGIAWESESLLDLVRWKLKLGFEFASLSDVNRLVWRPMVPPQILNLQVFAVLGCVSLSVLLFGILLAAWRIRRNWREEPPPVWMQQTGRVLATPVLLKSVLRRWLCWKLERNPMGWLERRGWTGRLITWSWFGIFTVFYSFALAHDRFFYDGDGTQATMAWLLMGSIAGSVAGSFRRERENGVLELLLVTPMTTRQIIGGRLRGIWSQFLPSVAVLLGVWVYFSCFVITDGWFSHSERELLQIIFFAGVFITMPVIGLYFSLRCRSHLTSFLLTLLCALILPSLVFRLFVTSWPTLSNYNDLGLNSLLATPGALPFQFLLAGCLGCLMYRRFVQRNFPMERAAR